MTRGQMAGVHCPVNRSNETFEKKNSTPVCVSSGLLFTTKTILCGIWRSKNGLRMLSMAKRLGSMSLNSPIVSQKYQTNSPFRLDCIYVSQFYPRHTLCSILLFKFWCYKFSLDTHTLFSFCAPFVLIKHKLYNVTE